MVLVNSDIVERVRSGEDISSQEGHIIVREMLRLALVAIHSGLEATLEWPVVIAMERIRLSEETVANADAKTVLDFAEELDAAISGVK